MDFSPLLLKLTISHSTVKKYLKVMISIQHFMMKLQNYDSDSTYTLGKNKVSMFSRTDKLS